MLSRKRTLAVLAVLLLALSASVHTSSEASAPQDRRQQPAATPQRPPTLVLEADSQVVTLCPDAESTANPRVRLKAVGHSPDGLPLSYRWKVSGGTLEGDGTDVVWDLSNAAPGVYSADVTLESGPSGDPLCTAFTSTKVVVRNCPPPRPVCPNVSIYCPDITQAGSPVTFTASIGAVTYVLVKLPPTYFQAGHERDLWRGHHPALRWAGIVLKNLLGVFLVLLGLVMSLPGVPGQGVLTILLGLMLMDFPGKRSLELKIVRRPRVFAAINHLRARFGKPPMVLDEERGLGRRAEG